MNHLLETVGLVKRFVRSTRQGDTEFCAVDGVDLAVDEGDFLSVTGPSGSGKTTLLTLLAGLATPSEGEVLYLGRNIARLSDAELSRLRNREISFIPQGMGLLGNLTVRDNVRSPQIFSADAGQGSGRADFLLDAMGLSDLADELPRNLSGGEIRRVSIARALFNEPSLVIADEPTNDLDPDNTRLVMDLLAAINGRGTGVVVVTHSAQVAARARRRLVMAHGRLLAGEACPAQGADMAPAPAGR